MAYLFSLVAECGPQKGAAEAVAHHFSDLTVTLADGSHFPCDAGAFQDRGNWWAGVSPKGVSRSGIRHQQDERELTEVGFVLYERLRSAPAFRYALVGIEVDGFRSFEELDDDVVTLDFSGLVLSDAAWQHLGSPGIFIPFAFGYHWRPFVKAS
jgi:hypothetical protein